MSVLTGSFFNNVALNAASQGIVPVSSTGSIVAFNNIDINAAAENSERVRQLAEEVKTFLENPPTSFCEEREEPILGEPPRLDTTPGTPVILDRNLFAKRDRYVLEKTIGSLEDYSAPNIDLYLGLNDTVRSTAGYFWYYLDKQFPEISPLENITKRFPQVQEQQTYSEYVSYGVPITSSIQVVEEALLEQGWWTWFTHGKYEVLKEKIPDIKLNDFVFDVNRAYNLEELRTTAEEARTNSLTVLLENDYNFYVSSYERLLMGSIDTKVTPNFYVLLTDSFSKSGGSLFEAYSTSFAHSDILTLSGALDLRATNDEYHDVFSINFNKADSSQKEYVSTKMTNVVFPYDEMRLYKEFEFKKEQMPFYIKLNIDTEDFGPVCGMLQEAQLTDLLLSYIATKEVQRSGVDREDFSIAALDLSRPTERNQNKMFLDLEMALENIAVEGMQFHTTSITYLGLLENTIKNINQNGVDSDYPLSLFVADSLLRSIKKDNLKKYQQILNGETRYNETLFYRVEKWEQNTTDNAEKRIQTFYLSNPKDMDSLQIIDSQIRYGYRYIYKIYSYKLVIGNEYSYGLVPDNNVIQVANAAKASIIDTYYGSMTGIVVDKPSPPPEVEIVPYKDNSENLLLMFNPSTVEYKMEPVFFNEQEQRDYDIIRESQQIEPEEKTIKFGGDDKTEAYQIYRIEKHPFSYEDFYDNLYKTVETLCNCTTAEFLETIEPNKKYYYLFRSVDVHGHISNPTEIYEVELVSENGLSFLLKKNVPFMKKEFKKPEKSMRRFLHIKPNLLQSYLPEQELDITGDAKQQAEQIQLGNENVLGDFIWGKQYKIRIKSKSTNKYIDVKFKFDQRFLDLFEKFEESCEE